MRQSHIIYPLTEKDQEALGMRQEFSEENGTIGVLLLRSRIREGVKRWKQRAKDVNIFEDREDGVADAIVTMDSVIENMKQRHETELSTMLASYQNQLKEASVKAKQEGRAAADMSYTTLRIEAERVTNLNKIRLERKDNIISELKTENESVRIWNTTYTQRYGETLRGTDPLNALQRFICWLFRI